MFGGGGEGLLIFLRGDELARWFKPPPPPPPQHIFFLKRRERKNKQKVNEEHNDNVEGFN